MDSIRQRLIERIPALSSLLGGYYPHLPQRLWEFRLTTNTRSTVIWESPVATVQCQREHTHWTVSLETDRTGRMGTETRDDLNAALVTAYASIHAVSEGDPETLSFTR